MPNYDASGRLIVRTSALHPTHLHVHRENVAAADGANAPAADSTVWLQNPGGYDHCLLFVYVTFTGGTNPAVVIRPYLRAGGSSGKVGGAEPVAIVGSVQRAIEVNARGFDVLAWIETITGSPSAANMDVYVAWL